jgi:hypothetical protein
MYNHCGCPPMDFAAVRLALGGKRFKRLDMEIESFVLMANGTPKASKT